MIDKVIKGKDTVLNGTTRVWLQMFNFLTYAVVFSVTLSVTAYGVNQL